MIVPPASPSSLLRYDSVIRLTQYISAAAAATSPDSFIAAWKAAFAASSPDGALYRELCRQVPEWSALANREIDNPIEAAFIEYMIVEPRVDLSALPALPTTQREAFSIVQDFHSVAFHFAKESQERPGALMFNLFEIDGPAGRSKDS